MEIKEIYNHMEGLVERDKALTDIENWLLDDFLMVLRMYVKEMETGTPGRLKDE